jgi:hypothetical protein
MKKRATQKRKFRVVGEEGKEEEKIEIPNPYLFKFPEKAETLAQRKNRIQMERNLEENLREGLYIANRQKDKVEFATQLENLIEIHPWLQELVDTFSASQIHTILTDYLNQSELTFREFFHHVLLQYKKNPQMYKENSKIRIFLTDVLSKLKYDDYGQVIDMFNEKIAKEDEISIVYAKIIQSFDIVGLRRFIRLYLLYLKENKTQISLSDYLDNYLKSNTATPKNQQVVDEVVTMDIQAPNVTDTLSKLLDEPVEEDVQWNGSYILRKAIGDMDIPKSLFDSIIAEATATSNTVRQFAQKLGSIIVLLRYSLNGIPAETFINRFKSGYYRADILLTMTLEEKMPEIFHNRVLDKSLRKKIAMLYDGLLRNFEHEFAEILYRSRHVVGIGAQYMFGTPNIDMEMDATILCSNKSIHTGIFAENIIHDSRANIVSYIDDGLLYCFDIKVLKKYFASLGKDEEAINPYTGNVFSEDFVKNYIEYTNFGGNILCKNSKDIQNIPQEFIVHYFDKKVLYCFDVREIKKNGIVINPYTQRAFSSRFLEMVNSFQFSQDDDEENEMDTMYKTLESEELAPGLIDILIQGINVISPLEEIVSDYNLSIQNRITIEMIQKKLDEIPSPNNFEFKSFLNLFISTLKQNLDNEEYNDFQKFVKFIRVSNGMKSNEYENTPDTIIYEIRDVISIYSPQVIRNLFVEQLPSEELIAMNPSHEIVIREFIEGKITSENLIESIQQEIKCQLKVHKLNKTTKVSTRICKPIGSIEIDTLEGIMRVFRFKSSERYKGIRLNMFYYNTFKYYELKREVMQFISKKSHRTLLSKEKIWKDLIIYDEEIIQIRKQINRILIDNGNLHIVMVYDSANNKYIDGYEFVDETMENDMTDMRDMDNISIISNGSEFLDYASIQSENGEKSETSSIGSGDLDDLLEGQSDYDDDDGDEKSRKSKSVKRFFDEEAEEVRDSDISSPENSSDEEEYGESLGEDDSIYQDAEPEEDGCGGSVCYKCRKPISGVKHPLKTMYVSMNKEKPNPKLMTFCSSGCINGTDVI